MRTGLDLNSLFPIKDAASARLMLIKARCLLEARLIDQADAAAVFSRANAMLFLPETKQAA